MRRTAEFLRESSTDTTNTTHDRWSRRIYYIDSLNNVRTLSPFLPSRLTFWWRVLIEMTERQRILTCNLCHLDFLKWLIRQFSSKFRPRAHLHLRRTIWRKVLSFHWSYSGSPWLASSRCRKPCRSLNFCPVSNCDVIVEPWCSDSFGFTAEELRQLE